MGKGLYEKFKVNCKHEHLDMDGVCHRCGADCRGIGVECGPRDYSDMTNRQAAALLAAVLDEEKPRNAIPCLRCFGRDQASCIGCKGRGWIVPVESVNEGLRRAAEAFGYDEREIGGVDAAGNVSSDADEGL